MLRMSRSGLAAYSALVSVHRSVMSLPSQHASPLLCRSLAVQYARSAPKGCAVSQAVHGRKQPIVTRPAFPRLASLGGSCRFGNLPDKRDAITNWLSAGGDGSKNQKDDEHRLDDHRLKDVTSVGVTGVESFKLRRFEENLSCLKPCFRSRSD